MKLLGIRNYCRGNAAGLLHDKTDRLVAAKGKRHTPHTGYQCIQRKRPKPNFHLARLDLRQVKYVVYNQQKSLPASVYHPKRIALAVCQIFGITLAEGLGHADDHVHRRTYLMAHIRKKMTLGLTGRLSRLPGLL